MNQRKLQLNYSNENSEVGDCVLIGSEENEIQESTISPPRLLEETIPDVATSTCKGQFLLVDIIDEIPYDS